MRLKSTNIPLRLQTSGFHLEQRLPHRDLWDNATGRVAVFDKSQLKKEDHRWFRGPLENLIRWIEIAHIDSVGQEYARTQFILTLRCS